MHNSALAQPVAPVGDAMTKNRQPPHETLEALATAARRQADI
jgi:hypothetical protein